MRMYIDDNKLVKTETTIFPFHFDLSEKIDNSLKHESEFIIKQNESLA